MCVCVCVCVCAVKSLCTYTLCLLFISEIAYIVFLVFLIINLYVFHLRKKWTGWNIIACVFTRIQASDNYVKFRVSKRQWRDRDVKGSVVGTRNLSTSTGTRKIYVKSVTCWTRIHVSFFNSHFIGIIYYSNKYVLHVWTE